MGLRLLSVAGLVVMMAIAWGLSENRKAINWRLIAWALGLQLLLGVILLVTGLREPLFHLMRVVVNVLNESTLAGATFVFGEDLPSEVALAFQVLPVIIFVSALSAILYYVRIIPVVVRGIAWLMRRTMKTSGAETLGAALLIFIGIEGVSAIRGYLAGLTRSELCTIMTTFMATIAGSVLVIYGTVYGAEPGHLATASFMSAPAAILISKLLVPETDEPATAGEGRIELEVSSANVLDAATQGTADGLKMALNVGAILIVFVGLVHLINMGFGLFNTSFQEVAGWFFAPFAFVMGVPWGESLQVGQLLGTKSILNEFLAYSALSEQMDTLSPRAVTLATYALCGFANPGSIGIAIAGLDALVPERRRDVSSLGWKSYIGGTLACFMTACVAGMLVA
jgi:CNT family concentrative nucleoside transporter